MKLVTLAIALFIANSLFAQGSWLISMNKKVLISSSVSDENINQKVVKSAEWKRNGYLEVQYTAKDRADWKHMLQFTDEKGNEILKKEDTKNARLQLSSLRRSFAGKKQIKIYMVVSPPNPMMMAPSRIIHLGTLKLP